MKNIYLILLLFLFSTSNIVVSQNLRNANKNNTLRHFDSGSSSLNTAYISPLVITYIDSTNIVQAITNTLFGGGINVSNVQYAGEDSAIAYFQDTTNSFGIQEGLVLTTGRPALARGPNDLGGVGFHNNIFISDSNISTISGGWQYDVAKIEFDFIPSYNVTNTFKLVFGSEEYPEYVNSGFNDVFGFFISGPGIVGTQNIAMIPGTTNPVTIDNINANSNSNYFINNSDTANSVLQYDGYTTPFLLSQNIQIGQTYHFKIVIADINDNELDSGVFIEGASFFSNDPATTKDMNRNTQKVLVYPNPARNTITISNTQKTVIRIYDTLGNKLLEKQSEMNMTLDISSLSEGIYTIIAENSNGRTINKVVIVE